MGKLIISVEIEDYTPEPTKEEIEACPETFTCFNCLESRPREKFAGHLSGERICRYCRPYVDSWTIGGQRKFDNRTKKGMQAPEKPVGPRPATNEDWQLSEDGVSWFVQYPAEPNKHTLEYVRVSPEVAAKIEKIRSGYFAWRDYAYRYGFPDFVIRKTEQQPPAPTTSKPWGTLVLEGIAQAKPWLARFDKKIWVLPLIIADKGKR